MNKYLQYLLTAGSSGNSLKLCFAWAAAQGGKRLLQRGFTRQPFPSLPSAPRGRVVSETHARAESQLCFGGLRCTRASLKRIRAENWGRVGFAGSEPVELQVSEWQSINSSFGVH